MPALPPVRSEGARWALRCCWLDYLNRHRHLDRPEPCLPFAVTDDAQSHSRSPVNEANHAPLLPSQQPRSASLPSSSFPSHPVPEIKNNAIVEIQQRPKRRRKPLESSSSLLESTSLCTSDTLDKAYAISDHPRRSSRITPTELLRRETALEIREQECRRRADELEERSLSLSKKEDEASTIMSQIAVRESKATLAQLEEHFTCALCVLRPLLGLAVHA